MRTIFLVAVIAFSACHTTARFPLCAKLAQSKPAPDTNYRNVGLAVYKACQKHHISIEVLSADVAAFKGSRRQMKWLQENYHILLCDFNQDTGHLGAQDYTTCIVSAQKWISVIQQAQLQKLMLDGTYCPVCVPNSNCH